MSIREITLELYRMMKRVEQLESQLAAENVSSPQRLQLEQELKRAKSDCQRLRAILAGAKSQT